MRDLVCCTLLDVKWEGGLFETAFSLGDIDDKLKSLLELSEGRKSLLELSEGAGSFGAGSSPWAVLSVFATDTLRGMIVFGSILDE